MKKLLLLLALITFSLNQAQNVSIPDSNFKLFLLTHSPVIDTDGDNEIQVDEALDYTGSLIYENQEVNDHISNESLCSIDFGIGTPDYDNCILNVPAPSSSWSYIRDLTGLESFKNVSEINFSHLQLIINNNVVVSNFPNLTKFKLTFSDLMPNIGSYNVNIDISNNTNLTEINIENHRVFNHSNTDYLFYGNVTISSLNINNSNSIESIIIRSTGLSSLDVIDKINLNNLNLQNNNISTLNLDNNTNLTTLNCFNNNLNTLSLVNNLNLVTVDCGYNNLGILDTSNNSNLTSLICNGNNISALNVTNNTGLTKLECNRNNLTTLNVNVNTNITRLFCGYNNLSTLDVSNNNLLSQLEVRDNVNLTYINLKNGNNLNFSSYNYFNNLPALTTVCVDTLVSDLVTEINADVGHSVNYITNCSLGINENNLTEYTLSPNPASNIVTITSKTAISSIEIYNQLGQLVLSKYNSKHIDISILNVGFYFIKIKDYSDNYAIEKILKK